MEMVRMFWTMIKTHKWRTAFCGAAFAFLIYDFGVLPWLDTWGTTAEERAMALAGDELVPGKTMWAMNQGVTIHGTPEEIYPYFAQMGQKKAGFYSYDWLERLFGFGIYNSYTLKPEWEMKAGDFCYFHKAGMGMRIHSTSPPHSLVMITDSRSRNQPLPEGAWEMFPVPGGYEVAWNWSFNMIPMDSGTTRVLVRTYAAWTDANPILNFVLKHTFALPSDIMDRKMLLTVKRLVEEHNGHRQ
jgi:hypothetical protein